MRARGLPLVGLWASLDSVRGSESVEEPPEEKLCWAETAREDRGEALGRRGVLASSSVPDIFEVSGIVTSMLSE